LRLNIETGFSRTLLDAFDRGALDAVVVLRESERRDGEALRHDRLGWFAAPSYIHRAGEPVRLATLAPPCGVHAAATRALDAARVPWVTAFVGGGVSAVAAAAIAGLGIAPLASRVAPPGTVDVGPSIPLPKLPRTQVMLHSQVSDPRLSKALRVLAATFRAPAG
jgi:DNA-binding transcriptional LysR family regulator